MTLHRYKLKLRNSTIPTATRWDQYATAPVRARTNLAVGVGTDRWLLKYRLKVAANENKVHRGMLPGARRLLVSRIKLAALPIYFVLLHLLDHLLGLALPKTVSSLANCDVLGEEL